MELTTISRRRISRAARREIFTPLVAERDRSDFPIIVHSHLAWDWVWQRPQQFHSRLSKTHPILFVEGPQVTDQLSSSRVTLREVSDYPNIVVLQMQMPASRFWTDGAWVDAERRRIVQSVLEGPLGRKFENPVQWFYDPMAVTAFAGHMDEQAIVYDCMDELSQFRGAPPELVRRERELLAVADVVFAGGPKIAKAKRRFNSNCYSFGCGVDVAHFGKARRSSTRLPKDIAHLFGAVLGYIGVVDERLDYELLAALADHDPSWNVVMVGPWTKVDPAEFPQRSNLHFLGGRDYSQLPAYAKGFDVCLMPFAKNEATEYINPTKALEYMATGRTIVSMDVEDVVVQFSEVVRIADNYNDFIAHCAESVSRPAADRIQAGLKLARKNSWESIVSQLEKHVEDVLATKHHVASSAA
jgi:glycosyltransferase involved in cell wall biosynthesis